MSNVNGQVSDVKTGFTLPELMIAVSILVIISLIAVASFRSFDSLSKLRGARDQIISDLQDMQSWARSGKLVNICINNTTGIIDIAGDPRGICGVTGCATGSSCQLSVPPGGYGVFFDYTNKKYVLFADIFDGSATMKGTKGCTSSSSACSYEKLIDGTKILPSKTEFGISGNYRNLNKSDFMSGNNSYFPIQIIFHNDNSISIKDRFNNYSADTDNLIVEKIPIYSSPNTVYVYVNMASGLIYGDSDSMNPSGTP